MDIRPILSALLRNKTGAILIALQIAFTFAVVVNSAYIITTRIEKMARPSGLDEPDIFSIRVQGFAPNFDFRGMIEEDTAWLEANPDIIAVSPVNAVPLSGGGWSSSVEPEENLEQSVSAGIFWMNENAVDALGIELIAGRNLTTEDIIYFEDGEELAVNAALMTRAMAEELWPDETEFVGKRFQWGDDHYVTIVGVIDRMQAAWVGWSGVERVIVMGGVLPGPGTRYLIRTADGQRDAIMPMVEEGLADRNTGRVAEGLRSLEEYRANSYQDDRAMAIVMGVVMILLIAITAMGIVGLASFSVNQRTKQIGTRRALGARKGHILSYFLTENLMVTTMGLLLGSALTVGLNIWLVNTFELDKLNWTYLPAGIVFLWCLGQLSTWQPARRASNISPAVATRTV
jgi:putative ABC transport system permease protein